MPRPTKKPKETDPYPPGWEPFLSAINADLDDDTSRHVFADWFQENGDEPRAEFIRLQCELARGNIAGQRRAEQLLTEHRARWLLGLPKGLRERPEWCVFRRGLLASLTVLGKHWSETSHFEWEWDAKGKEIRRITALEELRFEQGWNTLMESWSLIGLRALTLSSAGSGMIESLAKSPILPTLSDLSILAKGSDGTSQRSFRNLFASKKLTGLRRLCIESMGLGNVVAEGLSDPRFAGLETLQLRHLSLDTVGAESLANSPAITNLRILDLLNNQFGDAGLRALLASPGLRKLEELNLASCGLSAASAQLLTEWEGLRTVRKLDIRGSRIGPSERHIILSSPNAVLLTEENIRIG